jgi:hypothetical protein
MVEFWANGMGFKEWCQGQIPGAKIRLGALKNMIIADHPPRSPAELLPIETIPQAYFGACIFRVQGFKGARVLGEKIIF